jgi:hypothetical protein
MGAFDDEAMRQVVRAIEEAMAAMGVRDGRPARAQVAAE